MPPCANPKHSHLPFRFASRCLSDCIPFLFCATHSLDSLPARFHSRFLPATAAAPVHRDLRLPGNRPSSLYADAHTISLSLSRSRRDTICQPPTRLCAKTGRRRVTGAARRKPCAKNLNSPRAHSALFVYTVSAARPPVLPLRSPVFDVALLILIGTKITSIFPFSTVFCTYHARRSCSLPPADDVDGECCVSVASPEPCRVCVVSSARSRFSRISGQRN